MHVFDIESRGQYPTRKIGDFGLANGKVPTVFFDLFQFTARDMNVTDLLHWFAGDWSVASITDEALQKSVENIISRKPNKRILRDIVVWISGEGMRQTW